MACQSELVEDLRAEALPTMVLRISMTPCILDYIVAVTTLFSFISTQG